MAKAMPQVAPWRIAAIVAMMGALAVSTPANAQSTIYTAHLTGSAVVPPVSTTATGLVTLTLDVNLRTINVNASFSGLVSPATASHIHCCAPAGTNAAVAVPFPSFPTGTSGTYNQTLDLTSASTYSPAFVLSTGGTASSAFNALVTGLSGSDTYVDIHDSVFPGGEIRGIPAATPVLQNAVSRKVHGATGTFDLALSSDSTNPTTEPRTGPSQTIVLTFDKPINAASVTVTEGVATASAPTFSGKDVVVNLTGVNNQQYVTVALTAVGSNDGGLGGNGSVRVGFLLSDVNRNRVISVADLGLVNAQLAQVVTAANYLDDVNANGTLSVADKAITNANLTKSLPPP